MQSCSSEQEILRDVKESSTLLQNHLQSVIGERLYKTVMEQMETSEIQLSAEDLDKVIRFFNRYDRYLEKLANKPDHTRNVLETLENALLSLNSSKMQESVKTMFVGTALLAIVLFFAYRYAFPVYFVLLCLFSVYNVYKTYSVYKIMVVHKAVSDNVKSIEDLLHQQVLEELEKQIAETDEFYQSKIDRTENEIQTLKQNLSDIAVSAESSFQFDDSEMKTVYSASIKRRESKESDLYAKQHELSAELDKMYADSDNLKKQLDEMIGDLQKQYLDFSKVGDSFIFDPTFLFDIDSVKNKPIFFKHPEASCLFLYSDRDEAIGFIKLLCVQIRSRLAPTSHLITYFDEKTLGQDCLYFVPVSKNKHDPVSALFSIITTADEFRNKLNTYSEEIRSRQKDLREDKDIATFNKHMIELESITLPYQFCFALDVDTNVLTGPNMQLLTRSGGAYGIFMHVFMSIEEFAVLGQSAKKIVEPFSEIFILQNGSFNTRAKDYVLENLVEKK